MMLANDFEDVLIAFNKQKVEYIIAWGYAVIFHGNGRTTGDFDIWVKPTTENQKKIIKVFENLKFPTELLDYINAIDDFSKPFAIKTGEEPLQIDVFNAITGVSYAEAEKKAIPFKFSSTLESRFIHLYDLITNKMLTGRTKDKADVEELQKINIHSKDKAIVAFLKKLFRKK